jgi:pyruvate formate lyase activating enzyme
MKEAMLYEKMDGERVRCNLCNHRCVIAEGERGLCKVRENQGGTLYSLVYGKTISKNIDPIEKKPLFHFQPGSTSLSIATVGCNFACEFCQNYHISQVVRDHGELFGEDFPPEDAVRTAKRHGCKSVSYTYTEPTIFMEYAYDIARLAKEEGIRNVFVSNGYMTPEAIEMIKPYLDGINVDLKAFKEETYARVMKASLKRLLESIRKIKEAGIWMEITTLIIPTMNDEPAELAQIAEFIASLGVETPWHVSRFHPMYRWTHVPATPVSILKRAVEIGREKGLRYVYSGNVPGDENENTRCYRCGDLLIRRFGFSILEYRLRDGKCPKCSTPLDGVEV